MVNQLQLLIHIPLIGIDFPDNVKNAIGMFKQISDFDVVSVDEVIGQVFTVSDSEDEQVNPKFADFNYQHINILQNLGTHILILFGIIVAIALSVILKALQHHSIK